MKILRVIINFIGEIMSKKYMIHKTEARYNIHGVDTYRILKKADKPIAGFSNSWILASDKLFFTQEDAEKELLIIKGKK